jgi:hypothetical protein
LIGVPTAGDWWKAAVLGIVERSDRVSSDLINRVHLLIVSNPAEFSKGSLERKPFENFHFSSVQFLAM